MRLVYILFALILLCSCATTNYPCLRIALDEAKQIQDKDRLLFIEGDYDKLPFGSRHVQLWILQDGIYQRLTGGLIKEYRFRATDYYSYDGYIKRVERYDW